jgi:CubicO group peptidase (beta-lactamase class C family)
MCFGRLSPVLLLAAALSAQTAIDPAPYDDMLHDLMHRYSIPGAALAMTKDGRFVLSRGYGRADVQPKSKVRPDSLFRIASLSKTITAVAVMKLVDEHRLDLDAPASAFWPTCCRRTAGR